jgi:hypothetical protein
MEKVLGLRNRSFHSSLMRRIFVGVQIKELMNDRNFDEVLQGTAQTALEAFRFFVDNLLASHKVPN